MTVALYARRKNWPLQEVLIRLRHSKIHAQDCESCETKGSMLDRIDSEIERFGLNSTQYIVLKHLGEGTARTAADLCRLNRYDTGAMTRILDRLEEKGLVRRERGREDRRVVFLRLAPAGRALLPRLMAIGTRVLEVHLAGFNVDEVEALKGYLQRMIDN